MERAVQREELRLYQKPFLQAERVPAVPMVVSGAVPLGCIAAGLPVAVPEL